MEANCREIWITEFLPRIPVITSINNSDDAYLREIMGLSGDKRDEFERYIHSDPTPIGNLKMFNPIGW